MKQMIVSADGTVTCTFVSNILQDGAIEVKDETLWGQVRDKANRVKIVDGFVKNLHAAPAPSE